MRLLSVQVKDYRLHHDLSIEFDSGFTVIAGPNQSGKSTLVEAIHRALFLPVKTGGELLKGMQTDPFMAAPEVKLFFEVDGQSWQLRKRFAGSRGSTYLRASSGKSLHGDEAEELLAILVGTSAVSRTRTASEQLKKERWGHLWVWQGESNNNPLALTAKGYDHDRLVERLQDGADLSVQSKLDMSVIDDIYSRWSLIYTAGGTNRAPQVKRSSNLNAARVAVQQVKDELEEICDRINQQAEAELSFHEAEDQLSKLKQIMPSYQKQRLELEQKLVRCRKLKIEIAFIQSQLEAAEKDRIAVEKDRDDLTVQRNRVRELEAIKAPDEQKLLELIEKQTELETKQSEGQSLLKEEQQSAEKQTSQVSSIEAQQFSLKLLQEQGQLQEQLLKLQQVETRRKELQKDLEKIPAVTQGDVEDARRMEGALRDAMVRAKSLATGIEVIRAGQRVRLNGEELQLGNSQLFYKKACLQIGNDVEIRLLPGGGTSASQARKKVAIEEKKFKECLKGWRVETVEEIAQAERQRADLLASQKHLEEKADGGDISEIHQRLQTIAIQLLEGSIDNDNHAMAQESITLALAKVSKDLVEAQQIRNAANEKVKQQQTLLDGFNTALDKQKENVDRAKSELSKTKEQLLKTNTRIEALLERRGTDAKISEILTSVQEQCNELKNKLHRFQNELEELSKNDGVSLEDKAHQMDQQIKKLNQQERDTSDARIRSESALHADGKVDLQAEQEQKRAELELSLIEQERLEKEAGMLSLLRQLLEEEQNVMASQYTTPLTKKIGNYLGLVFPESPKANLSYDARNGFQGLQWQYKQEATFNFEVLSAGAREQFAAALRLTMAEVLAEAYDGTLPMVFDDAFVNSDADRQVGIKKMLEKAVQQGLQIILLTSDSQTIMGNENVKKIMLPA